LPNGFDLERFRPNPRIRHDLRRRLGVGPQDFLVGMIARFHPVKDHESLLIAFREVAERFRSAYCALVGAGCDASNLELVAKIAALDLKSRVLLLGEIDDVSGIYPALDAHCLTSRAEGFPNVVGESMCCEVPNVATDVGCVREILGEAGSTVPRGDTPAIAAAIRGLLEMSHEHRAALGAASRRRISERYDVRTVVQQYERVLVAAALGNSES
jgi:glycosyltransferase involved in cell wall biosynthesis